MTNGNDQNQTPLPGTAPGTIPPPPPGMDPTVWYAMWAEVGIMEAEAGEEAELSREVLRDILGGLDIEVPYTMEEVEEAAMELMRVEALERAARLFGMGPEFLDPLQEQLGLAEATLLERATDRFGAEGGAVSTAISEYVTSTIERQETVAREEVLTRREYLDVPTPEEFLDQFDVALATHTQGLVESGELDRDTAQWIMDNPDILFDEYIGEMGQRAAAGEQIFKPVGLEGEPELAGVRPGRQEVRAVGTEREALTETLTQAQQTAQATRGGITTPAATQRTTQEQQQLTEKEQLAATFAETEEVYTRPKLGYTYALSPLDWLAEFKPATEITYGAEREKGRREGERRGAVAITPRRVR